MPSSFFAIPEVSLSPTAWRRIRFGLFALLAVFCAVMPPQVTMWVDLYAALIPPAYHVPTLAAVIVAAAGIPVWVRIAAWLKNRKLEAGEPWPRPHHGTSLLAIGNNGRPLVFVHLMAWGAAVNGVASLIGSLWWGQTMLIQAIVALVLAGQLGLGLWWSLRIYGDRMTSTAADPPAS